LSIALYLPVFLYACYPTIRFFPLLILSQLLAITALFFIVSSFLVGPVATIFKLGVNSDFRGRLAELLTMVVTIASSMHVWGPLKYAFTADASSCIGLVSPISQSFPLPFQLDIHSVSLDFVQRNIAWIKLNSAFASTVAYGVGGGDCVVDVFWVGSMCWGCLFLTSLAFVLKKTVKRGGAVARRAERELRRRRAAEEQQAQQQQQAHEHID